MRNLPPHLKGLLIAVVGVLWLSPDALLVRLVDADPWTTAFWRCLLVAVTFTLIVVALRGRETLAAFRGFGATGWLMALFFGGGSILFALSVKHTNIANTLVILCGTPLVAALFSRFFLGERIRPATWVAVGAVVAGVATILYDNLGMDNLTGDLLAVCTTVSFAGNLTVQRAHGDGDRFAPLALGTAVAALALLPLASPGTVTVPDMGWLFLNGMVVMPVAFALILKAPSYLPAPEVALVMLLEPLLGPIWGWLAVGETASPEVLFAGAVIATAVAAHTLATRVGRRRIPDKTVAAVGRIER